MSVKILLALLNGDALWHSWILIKFDFFVLNVVEVFWKIRCTIFSLTIF